MIITVKSEPPVAHSPGLFARLESFGMNISIGQIREDDGLEVHHLYPEGEPRLEDEDSRITGRSSLDLRAERNGDEVQIEGTLTATVEIDCDRCLTPLSVPVKQSFDLLYIPPLKTTGTGDERELGRDDLSIAFYHDQTIDLDDLVREQIELTFPMARLCSEGCRGLCPECGANLNEGQCACRFEQIDPRWAALKELKSGN